MLFPGPENEEDGLDWGGGAESCFDALPNLRLYNIKINGGKKIEN